MPDVQYKGWVIEAQSYKSDSGRWRPKALVSIHEAGNLRTHVVPAPLERHVRHRGGRRRLCRGCAAPRTAWTRAQNPPVGRQKADEHDVRRRTVGVTLILGF
jgi:hypothetical protein